MASSPGDDTRLRCAVLVGAVGAGKSSIGNALCQKPSEPPPFRSRRSASGVTTACACAPCLAPGLGGAVVSSASERWWVVDTPGLRDGDDARAPEHLLRAIEACASPAGDINPTGGVDVFLLVFNATGRVSSGDLEAIETLKRRFGAARFLERAVAVFTHADVLIADGDANDENDENEIAASYLRDAPPALASLLRAAGGGRARVRGRPRARYRRHDAGDRKTGHRSKRSSVPGGARRGGSPRRPSRGALAAAIGVGRPARNARRRRRRRGGCGGAAPQARDEGRAEAAAGGEETGGRIRAEKNARRLGRRRVRVVLERRRAAAVETGTGDGPNRAFYGGRRVVG